MISLSNIFKLFFFLPTKAVLNLLKRKKQRMKRKSERPLSYKFMNSDYFPGKYPKHPRLPKKKKMVSIQGFKFQNYMQILQWKRKI